MLIVIKRAAGMMRGLPIPARRARNDETVRSVLAALANERSGFASHARDLRNRRRRLANQRSALRSQE